MNTKVPQKKTEAVSLIAEDRKALQAIAAATDQFPYEHVHAALKDYLLAHPSLAAVASAALAVANDVTLEEPTVGAVR